MHNIQSVLLGKNPLRGVSPRLRKKRLGDLATILTLDELVTRIPMGVAGPLPEGIVRLVLGRSSLSCQEISVVYGVVDSDYIGKIKVLISQPTKTAN